MNDQQPNPIIHEEVGATGEVQPEKDYGNFKRIQYFLCFCASRSIFRIEENYFSDNLLISFSIITFGILLLVVSTFYRMKNIGHNPWFSLLMVIPLVSAFVYIWSQCLPQGYWDTRKLDIAAIVLLVIYSILGILTVVTFTVLFIYMGFEIFE